MKTILSLILLSLSPFAFAGAEVTNTACAENGDEMGKAAEVIFERVSSAMTSGPSTGKTPKNRIQLGGAMLERVFEEDLKMPKAKAYQDELFKTQNLALDCEEAVLHWMNKHKDEIVDKYNLKYNPLLLANMIKSKSFSHEVDNCVVIEYLDTGVEKQCDGKRSPNSVNKVCTMRFVCPDANTQKNATVIEEIRTAVCMTAKPEDSCESVSLKTCYADESVHFNDEKQLHNLEKINSKAVGSQQ